MNTPTKLEVDRALDAVMDYVPPRIIDEAINTLSRAVATWIEPERVHQYIDWLERAKGMNRRAPGRLSPDYLEGREIGYRAGATLLRALVNGDDPETVEAEPEAATEGEPVPA